MKNGNRNSGFSRVSSQRRFGIASFTLLETVVALGLLMSVGLEVMSVQGYAVKFTEFDRKVTQATWLAKGIMAKIEWYEKFYPLKEIKDPRVVEAKIPEEMCPQDKMVDCDYKYSVSVVEWKFPFLELFSGMSEGSKNPMFEMIKGKVKEILGPDILKVARVEVSWPEGSKKNAVELSYLMTAQRGVDVFVNKLKAPTKKRGGSPPKKQGNESSQGSSPEKAR